MNRTKKPMRGGYSTMRLAIDCEWNIETGTFRCACLGESTDSSLPERIYKTSSLAKLQEYMQQLPSLLAGEPLTLVFHNGSADLKMLTRWQALPHYPFEVADSLIAARYWTPDLPTKKLKPYAREYGLIWEDEKFTDDIEVLKEYCAKDTYACAYIENSLVKQMPDTDQAIYEVNCQLVKAFLAMELAGVHLDRQYLVTKKTEIEAELATYAKDVPGDLLTNPHTVAKLVRERYSERVLWQKLDKTDKGALSFSAKSLRRLPRLSKKMLRIIDARALQEYLTMFVERPLSIIDSKDIFSTEYNILTAKTHRRTTSPAIQNWPASSRRCITSRIPEGKIVWLDYSNLEARLFAWQSGCKSFLEDMVTGGYMAVAKSVFKIDVKSKKDKEYKLVKMLVLATTYNMGVGQLIRNLTADGSEVKWDTARGYLDTFFDAYPEIYTEIERRKKYMHKHGKAWSSLGVTIPLQIADQKYFDEETYRKRIRSLENKAVNYPTQSLAGYVTGTALVDIQNAFASRFPSLASYWEALLATRTGSIDGRLIGFPIIETHDELTSEARHDKVEEVKEMMRHRMTNVYTLRSLIPQFPYEILNVSEDVADFWQ